MVLSDLKFSKEKVQEICNILEIPYFELNGDIELGSSEKTLLNNEDLNELTEKFCFIGVDGTTTRISDDAESPTQVSISNIMWGIHNMRTHTIKYDQRIVYEARELLEKSSVRTILEIKSVICLMLARNILTKIMVRCYEFKNGEVIFEDNLLEMDLFKLHARIKKGFFVDIDHYKSATEVKHITPKKVGVFRKIANFPLFRYLLIRMSIIVRYNIPWKLKVLYSKNLY